MAADEPRIHIHRENLTAGGALKGPDLEVVTILLKDSGGIALLPSDTCFSVAAPPSGVLLSRKINMILDRDDEPISLAFDGLPMVKQWATVTVYAGRLFEAFTPGPLTVVCSAGEHVEDPIIRDALAVPNGSLGVRIPDSQVERQISTSTEGPITTVAVRYPKTKAAVRRFDHALDIVLTGLHRLGKQAPLLAAIEDRVEFRTDHSTVVIVPGPNGRRYKMHRLGAIPEEEIAKAIGSVSSAEIRDWT